MTISIDMSNVPRFTVHMVNAAGDKLTHEVMAQNSGRALLRAEVHKPGWTAVSAEPIALKPKPNNIGGARKGAGRKPSNKPKKIRLQVLLTKEQHAAILARGGSTWLRDLALSALRLPPDPVKRILKQKPLDLEG